MRITPVVALAFAAFSLAPSLAFAQRVPFFTGAGTAVDPEISVVNSGEILDAQVVVSSDLKHVTINARTSSSELLALRDFTFVGSGVRDRQGLVGGAGRGAAGRDAANGAPARGRDDADGGDGNPPGRGGRRDRDLDVLNDDAGQDRSPADRTEDAPSPRVAASDRGGGSAGVLDRPGMTLVGRFED